MNRHRVLQHGWHANGMMATAETVARYRSYGRHKATASKTVAVTTVSPTATAISTVITAATMTATATVTVDELTADISSITTVEDEISSYPPLDQPDLSQHDPPMNEPQPKS